MATVVADPDLTKAFAEHQAKVIETTQRVKMTRAQIDGLKLSVVRAELTEQEVSSVPEDTRTYESVGRMFILQPVSNVVKRLQQEREEALSKIKVLEDNVEHLEATVKSSEDSVRELVLQKRKEL